MKRLSTYKSIAVEQEPTELFLGGVFEIQVVDGEKIVEGVGGQNIFGSGTFDSRVEIFCGDLLLGKSVIKSAMLEFRVGQRRWDGFDSVLKPMIITPDMPAEICIKIYECNRMLKNDVFGEAMLNIIDVTPGKTNSANLPIFKKDDVFVSSVSAAVGKVHVRTVFKPFLPNYIGADSTLAINENVAMNNGKFAVGVGYNTVLQDKISISLAMFNSDGNFVDAVSLKKCNSTRGLRACYESVVPHIGYLHDKQEISFELGNTPDNIKALFLILSDYTEFGSLENLKRIYIRIKENKHRKELYRYEGIEINKPATSAIMLRIVRDDANSKVWNFLTYDNVWAYDAREHGFIIPRMKSMLKDVIPECTWSNNDRLATLDSEESMSVKDHCADIPSELSIGLNWETTPKKKMSVDLGCVLLNSKWEHVDTVNAEQLQTACTSVKHGGEEQRDVGGDKDDQMIHITLSTIPENVTYICFYVISPTTNDKLDSGVSCSGKLLDKGTERVMCHFKIQDKKQFDYYCSMLMCFFFKLDDEWYFQVAGAGAAFVTTELIAEHAKKYLMDKRATQRRTQINSNNAKILKRYEATSKHTTPL